MVKHKRSDKLHLEVFVSAIIARSSVIVLLPLFTITMPNVTVGGIAFPHGNLVALLKHL